MVDDQFEEDSLGRVRVPAGALFGPQTARAVETFPSAGFASLAGSSGRSRS